MSLIFFYRADAVADGFSPRLPRYPHEPRPDKYEHFANVHVEMHRVQGRAKIYTRPMKLDRFMQKGQPNPRIDDRACLFILLCTRCDGDLPSLLPRTLGTTDVLEDGCRYYARRSTSSLVYLGQIASQSSTPGGTTSDLCKKVPKHSTGPCCAALFQVRSASVHTPA
jgi:hypothetical protein